MVERFTPTEQDLLSNLVEQAICTRVNHKEQIPPLINQEALQRCLRDSRISLPRRMVILMSCRLIEGATKIINAMSAENRNTTTSEESCLLHTLRHTLKLAESRLG